MDTGDRRQERWRLSVALLVAALLHLIVLVLVQLQAATRTPAAPPLGALTVQLSRIAMPSQNLVPPRLNRDAASLVGGDVGSATVAETAASTPTAPARLSAAARVQEAVAASATAPAPLVSAQGTPEVAAATAALAAESALARLSATAALAAADPLLADSVADLAVASSIEQVRDATDVATSTTVGSISNGDDPTTGQDSVASAAAAALDASLGAALAALPVTAAAVRLTADDGSTTDSARNETETVEWDDPRRGRRAEYTPAPVVPTDTRVHGACQVAVEFDLQPSGVLRGLLITEGSGVSTLDAAVLETMRQWRFTPAQVADSVHGRVTFICEVGG